MSQQNAEIVRRFIEDVNRQDLNAALAYVAAGSVLDWSDSEAPDSGRFTGPEAWGRWLEGRWEGLVDATFDASEIVDVGPGKVLLVARMRGRGRASGVETAGLGAAVVTLTDDHITGLRLYQSREEALAALGLDG